MSYQALIICDNNVRNDLLEKQNTIINNSYMNLSSLINNLTYSISKEAILFISKEMNIKPAFADELIHYIIYDRLFYDNPKLNYILEIKNRLVEAKLISKNDIFINFLKNKEVVFYKCKNDSNLKFAVNILKENNIRYRIENEPLNNQNTKRNVYSFNSIDDEARFVFNQIKQLLDSGVSTSNIKIANYSSDYDYVFKRLSSGYNIPISFNKSKNILSTSIAKELFKLIGLMNNFTDIVSELRIKYPNSQYLKRIINIINSYKLYNYRPSDTLELFKYELKRISYDNILYDNSIELIDFNQCNKNDYIFLIGFNNGLIPYIYKNQGYLSDDILANMGLDTALEINKRNHDEIVNILNGDFNITISYKERSNFSSFLPSTLIDELKYNIITGSIDFGVNSTEDIISLATHLEDYYKFNVKEDNFLDFIYDIDYYKYDNSFKGISNSLDKLPKSIRLSYTSMNDYIKCPFKFYINYILKIKDVGSTYSLDLGNYAHYILERSYNDNFDFEAVSEEAFNYVYGLKETKAKDLFFISLIKETLKNIIDFNKDNEGKTIFSNRLLEKNIIIKEYDGKLIFSGKIDKLVYDDSSSYTYYAVIDYKTGHDVLNLGNIEYGFNLQLPVYLYLISKSNIFENPKLIGLYLQKIRLDDKALGLKGYTVNDIDLVKKVFKDTLSSDYLCNIKFLKSGGFNQSSKLIDEAYCDEMVEIVDEYIKSTYKHIINGDFSIEPKMLGTTDMSCNYCKYINICYKKYKDYKILVKENNGGEDSEVE